MRRMLTAGLIALCLGGALAPTNAFADEEEVQALVVSVRSTLGAAEIYSDPSTLPVKGALSNEKLVYKVVGTKVYFAVKGSRNFVIAKKGEYAIGDNRVILVGRDGQMLNGNLKPVKNPENIRSLRKRPGRAKF